MNRSSLAWVSIVCAGLVATSGCPGCEVEVLDEVAPQIYLDVCLGGTREVGEVNVGGVSDCGIALGERDISVRFQTRVKVTNPSRLELTINEVLLTGDPAFSVAFAPEKIGAGLSAEIVLDVLPLTEADVEATLTILSDAKNTTLTADGVSILEVPITMTGVDNGVPDIEVNPLECDFGRVAVDGVQICNIEIRNVGTRALVMESVAFEAIGEDGALFEVPAEHDVTREPFAFAGRPPGPEDVIDPVDENGEGGTVTVVVRFTPDVLGRFAGLIRMSSNDPDETLIDFNLVGISVTPPTCQIDIESVNGIPTQNGRADVEPLDDVVLTLSNSEASTPEGSIASYQWNLVGSPVESSADLASPTSESTGFIFGATPGVDAVGQYCVRANVVDELGTASVNECSFCFDAIPSQSFLVQLSWDVGAGSDMDLHVTKADASGNFCVDGTIGGADVGPQANTTCNSDLDCYYGRRQAEWDGVAGLTPGDGTLDLDDVDGFGPENTNVDLATPGRYLIGTYNFDSTANVGVTMKLFLYGQAGGEWFEILDSGNRWMEPAIVVWPADPLLSPCVEDLSDNDATDDCGAP